MKKVVLCTLSIVLFFFSHSLSEEWKKTYTEATTSQGSVSVFDTSGGTRGLSQLRRINNDPDYEPPVPPHNLLSGHHYYPFFPFHKSYFRGSFISIYSGPGGWFFSEQEIWEYHPKRLKGRTYYSRPISSRQYLLTGDHQIVENKQGKRVERSSNSLNDLRFRPLKPEDNRCSKPPKITYNSDGSANLVFEKLPAECLNR